MMLVLIAPIVLFKMWRVHNLMHIIAGTVGVPMGRWSAHGRREGMTIRVSPALQVGTALGTLAMGGGLWLGLVLFLTPVLALLQRTDANAAATATLAAGVLTILTGLWLLYRALGELLAVRLRVDAHCPVERAERVVIDWTRPIVRTGDIALDREVVLHGDPVGIMAAADPQSRMRLRHVVLRGGRFGDDRFVQRWSARANPGETSGEVEAAMSLMAAMSRSGVGATAIVAERVRTDPVMEVRIQAMDTLLTHATDHPETLALVEELVPPGTSTDDLDVVQPATLLRLHHLNHAGTHHDLPAVRAAAVRATGLMQQYARRAESGILARTSEAAAGMISAVAPEVDGRITEAPSHAGALSRASTARPTEHG